MNQSSFIAGALLGGFVLYLAAQGRLSVYSAVLWGNTAAPVAGSGQVAQAAQAAVTPSASNLLNMILPQAGASAIASQAGSAVATAAPDVLTAALAVFGL